MLHLGYTYSGAWLDPMIKGGGGKPKSREGANPNLGRKAYKSVVNNFTDKNEKMQNLRNS